MTALRTEVVITHPTGLHARPAVKFTKLAKTFAAEIRLRGVPDGDVGRRQEHRQGDGR